MSRVDNQRRLFLELIEELRPWWRKDPGLPTRLTTWLTRHRAGSRDRRLYRELAYTAWRMLPWIENAAPETLVARVANHAENTRDTSAFVERFADPAIGDPSDGSDLLPDWLREQCPAAENSEVGEYLRQRAPLWIRLQTSDFDRVAAELDELGIPHEPSPHLPTAWRIAKGAKINSISAFTKGLIEVQDVGSQALLETLPNLTGQDWLDACAGAGGKSLQLAQLVGSGGRVTAHDIRPKALKELRIRQQRAGVGNIATASEITGRFSGVLVDAPCTGSGTWRRSPHLKWTTTNGSIRRASERQALLLSEYSDFVAEGGTLVYATCSLCRDENEGVADQFEQTHHAFRPFPLRHPVTHNSVSSGWIALMPHELDSDAYFVAAWQRC